MMGLALELHLTLTCDGCGARRVLVAEPGGTGLIERARRQAVTTGWLCRWEAGTHRDECPACAVRPRSL